MVQDYIKSLDAAIEKLENNEGIHYFFLPDFKKESGGMQLTYNHVKCMNENGFNAIIVHQKEGFRPPWLEKYFDDFSKIPIMHLEGNTMSIDIQDFLYIPEGMVKLMEKLQEQKVPGKKIVFCQNWYYILNSLPPATSWRNFGISDCMSVSQSQTDYINLVFSGIKTKQVYGQISSDVYYPPEKMTDKKLKACFIPSRDGGTKSHNVIKTFYALYPALNFISFEQIKGLEKDEYAKLIRECAFMLHFDEYSSWGTAPIEAFLSKTLVAGWDGVGGKEYMNEKNTWLANNGDIIHLADQIGKMIEQYIAGNVKEETYEHMASACTNYTAESEKDSIITAHNEWIEERIQEIEQLKESELNEHNKEDS